ncbi:MAG TPA: type 1 glutamine amidotransferase domain-containing protein [Acidimicrobiales bacterium]|nr:type 1 glutamine amidotransferase domain-containing protein [Acidimicrobiales bacterium]
MPAAAQVRTISGKADNMTKELSGRKIVFMVANEGVEQVELTRPWQAVEQAGGQPVLASTKPGKTQAFNHLDKADTFDIEVTTDQLRVGDYDGLVLPGGVANSDRLRTDAKAVQFVRAFFEAGKPAAVICHGPWMLVEADVVQGRRLTSWPSLQTDIRNAGADWVDEEVVECRNGANVLITSRKPDDLDAFCTTFLAAFASAAHRAA